MDTAPTTTQNYIETPAHRVKRGARIYNARGERVTVTASMKAGGGEWYLEYEPTGLMYCQPHTLIKVVA